MPTVPQLRTEILTVLEVYETGFFGTPQDSGAALYVLGGLDALRTVLAVVDGADAKTALAQVREATLLRQHNVTHPTQENRDR